MTSGGKRKGAGRPLEPEPKSKVLRVRLTEREARAVATAAKAHDLTVTNYVRRELGLDPNSERERQGTT